MNSDPPPSLIAQANIARLRYPLSHPSMMGMASRIDEMNRLAELSPGFVWRFEPDGKEENDLSLFSSYLQPFDEDRFFFNMSIWTDTVTLNDYVHQSAHRDLLKNRDRWIQEIKVRSLAIWPIAEGHLPSVREAVEQFGAPG